MVGLRDSEDGPDDEEAEVLSALDAVWPTSGAGGPVLVLVYCSGIYLTGCWLDAGRKLTWMLFLPRRFGLLRSGRLTTIATLRIEPQRDNRSGSCVGNRRD